MAQPRNASVKANVVEPAVAMGSADMPGDPPAQTIKGSETPVRSLSPREMKALGQKLNDNFGQYKSDRQLAEMRWLRNQRQYLGIYDEEIEKQFAAGRSRAYPRITRMKCISVLSRLMNLMFPGNERNWALEASPSPDMKPEEVQEALQAALKRDQEAGVTPTPDIPYIMRAIKVLADQRAEAFSVLIDDQLQEIGGDQTLDYIALERRVISSGIIYGLGVLRGPFVREAKTTVWKLGADGKTPEPETKTVYKPMFEFVPVWDYYPDMTAKTLAAGDGYYLRNVMSRSQLRALADRSDFFGDIIKAYLSGEGRTGNYSALNYESELRSMGVKNNAKDQKTDTSKYEVISWHGPVTGDFLSQCGVEIDADKLSDEIDAEVWLVAGYVIKADMNPWAKLNRDVRTIHTFVFDEDDTSPIGAGLPNAMRDSQMAISAMARMYLDNASVVCGPNLELNTDLLRLDQDLTSVSAYKMWYREGSGQDAQFPAVRNVEIDAHLKDLMTGIKFFMELADAETFVGPQTGGDLGKMPSEPMRTAAGASMLRGDAALPFKDIVRNFDTHTQSVIDALVQFNMEFNPEIAPEGDFNVIARGATSLIAKEVRGANIDQIATTLTPDEKPYVDMRKLIHARFAARDLIDMLVDDDTANRNIAQAGQAASAEQQRQQELNEANVRKLLSDAFKNIAQGQKNSAMADAASVKSALELLEQGITQTIAGMNGGANNPSGATGGNGTAPAALPSPADAGSGGGAPAPALAA